MAKAKTKTAKRDTTPRHQRKTRQLRTMAHVREGMLRAAAGVLAHRGVEATTMRHIAAEAGYTVPSLYAYFKGRQEIIDALESRTHELVCRTFTDTMPAGLTFPQKLELLVHRQLQFGEEWREAFIVSFATRKERPGEPGLATSDPRSADDPYDELMMAWLQRHAQSGDIGTLETQEFACILRGILQAMFQRWLRTGKPEQLTTRSAAIVQLLLYGVAGTAAASDSVEAARALA